MTFLSVLALRGLVARGELDEVQAFRMHYMMHRIRTQYGQSPLPQHMADRLAELRGRARLRAAIAEHAVDGRVALAVTQMDCDCAQWSSTVTLLASVDAINAYLERLYDDAEGPVTWSFISPEEQAEFVPQSRDLALEAFENGHPHVVHA